MARSSPNGWTIDVAIKALEDRGVARRLAEPNLIARSGQKASFLAGGEFPIPVSGDDGQITVEYKKFGVGLDFTPTVLADGLIWLDIAPEVSSVDTSASVRDRQRISVPGFVVRRAQTSIDLKNGQSFMMAGLLQSENNMINQSIPGLGKLPVLGPLFSSKAYQRRETDLVIIVTPYLVKPIDPSKKPRVPTDATLPASPVDYFLGNTEEIKVSDAGRAADQARRRRGAGRFGPYPRPAGGISPCGRKSKLAVLIGLAGLGSGCMSDEYRRADGLTDGAGNAHGRQHGHADGRSLAGRRREHEAPGAGRARHARQALPTTRPTPRHRRRRRSGN